MRKTQKGKVHQHSTNIQDHDRLNLSPQGKALFMFEQWAGMAPKYGYYDLLPPAARMAVDAVAAVLDTLDR
jgi:hypothetical protein